MNAFEGWMLLKSWWRKQTRLYKQERSWEHCLIWKGSLEGEQKKTSKKETRSRFDRVNLRCVESRQIYKLFKEAVNDGLGRYVNVESQNSPEEVIHGRTKHWPCYMIIINHIYSLLFSSFYDIPDLYFILYFTSLEASFSDWIGQTPYSQVPNKRPPYWFLKNFPATAFIPTPLLLILRTFLKKYIQTSWVQCL